MSNDDRDIMEMTDIAEKMRYRSQWMGTDAIVSALLSNGADEVERLRALVARQREWIDGVRKMPPSAVDMATNSILITRPAPFEDK